MPPPRVSSARLPRDASVAPPSLVAPQSAQEMADTLTRFLESHRGGAVLEDGKTAFELGRTQFRVAAEHGRCVLQLWSGDRTLVRTVTVVTKRSGCLRLSTTRFGQPQIKSLTFVPALEPREPSRREPARQQYLRLLQRVLAREFPDWQVDGFRVAMDLERSFGPAYARGSLLRGKEAWAVIGAGAAEAQAILDGVLTLGVLWLHHCRERADSRRLYKGLRVVVPHGTAAVTLARLPWMNHSAAQWELFELQEHTEELVPRDAADQGNLRTRLLHHPDQTAAQERFAPAIAALFSLVPAGEQHRVEQRLRSTAELAFLLHGLEFARARISLAGGTFAHTLEISVGVGSAEMPLNPQTRPEIAAHMGELFARRSARTGQRRDPTPHVPGRGIGEFTGKPAHSRLGYPGVSRTPAEAGGMARLERREQALAAQQDPLYRAAPERWLESVLRENLAPLTRWLAPRPQALQVQRTDFANEADPDNRGNRASPDAGPALPWDFGARSRRPDCLIPHFDSRFVYTQVPAIAGASDRGMLDLLGITEDGRLAVIELKASDDLQLALQGLDYWIRVRHHHASTGDSAPGLASHASDLQRHGYFCGVELSPEPPRLFLVAPALHVHPATETVLRYLSSRVEWTLLALDERWRQEIRVVWRKSGGGSKGGRL